LTIAQVLSDPPRSRASGPSYNLVMPGFRIERSADGRRSLHVIGCCGDPERWRREYDQVFLEQTLAEGGRVVSSGPDGVELVDARGRTHHLGAHVLAGSA
jgi:hypothetical protein